MIDIAEFCAKYAIPPSYVTATETGLRIRDLPDELANPLIEALLASGMITSYEDETVDQEWGG